jgi:hypothetical protein
VKFPDDMPEPERLKLCAARYIRDKHRQLTPSSRSLKAPEHITWRQWWERRFCDNYGRYIRQYFEHFKPERKA